MACAFYWMINVKLNVCVNPAPVALTDTGKLPVDVPVTTLKFTAVEVPPPGAGFVTVTGNVPMAARSSAVSQTDNCFGLM